MPKHLRGNERMRVLHVQFWCSVLLSASSFRHLRLHADGQTGKDCGGTYELHGRLSAWSWRFGLAGLLSNSL